MEIFGRYKISPTLLPTDLGRRYFHNTDGKYSVGIFQAGNFFFWRARSVGKTVGKCFFCIPDRYSDGMWNHRQKAFRREYSVGNIVGKYFTDERSITHRQNMSVSKIMKSCSVRMGHVVSIISSMQSSLSSKKKKLLWMSKDHNVTTLTLF